MNKSLKDIIDRGFSKLEPRTPSRTFREQEAKNSVHGPSKKNELRERPVNAKNEEWRDEDKKLIEWFLTLTISDMPQSPFELKTAVQVLNSSRFFEMLNEDIASGPNGPRARFGALQNDLKCLLELVKMKKLEKG